MIADAHIDKNKDTDTDAKTRIQKQAYIHTDTPIIGITVCVT